MACRAVEMSALERRAGGSLQMMAARAGLSASSRQLAGIAVPFDVTTTIGTFTESIRPSAVNLDRDRDIRLLWNHDAGIVLGRTTASTLKLRTGPRGITFAGSIPSWADGYGETLRRGDVDGMSFGFVVLEDSWTQGDGLPHRTILDLELHEISIVAFPAYPHTSVLVGSGLAAPRAAAPAGSRAEAYADLAAARARLARAEAAAIRARAVHTQLARNRNREIDTHARLRLAAVG